MKILNDIQDKLLQEERSLLNELRVALVQFGADKEDKVALDHSIQQLDEFFLLVVVGEFNAGKSAFINALLGQAVLLEGVTPTTTQINILRYGSKQERVVIENNIQEIYAPVEILTEISVVDTPGTNAIIREHEEITSNFIPRSDMVLFITSADRPFTESERTFLGKIHNWGKKVVIIINKIDILQNEDELTQIKTFITENAQSLLGMKPEIFPVSARFALQAKTGQPQLWERSLFGPLENYIHDTLDEDSRLRLKFINPLGVGKHLTEHYLEFFDNRLNLLQEDLTLMSDIENQMAVYRKDMARDFMYRISDIENLLYEMEQRGVVFFDDLMRLVRVFDLLKKDKIQHEFKTKVVAALPQQMDKKVNELIDWLIDSDLRQWHAVTDHVADRKRKHQGRIIGDFGVGSFHYIRESLIDGIGRESKDVIETYDKTSEAREIAQGAQKAVAASAALEVGALGLGAVVTAIATTVAADVTGILLASFIAAMGLFIIPNKRRLVKKEMGGKISEMRGQLVSALDKHFQNEINRSLKHMDETISPYTRFVRAEKSKNTEAVSKLEKLKTDITRLFVKVNEMSG
jgi:small GTP-binding protein